MEMTTSFAEHILVGIIVGLIGLYLVPWAQRQWQKRKKGVEERKARRAELAKRITSPITAAVLTIDVIHQRLKLFGQFGKVGFWLFVGMSMVVAGGFFRWLNYLSISFVFYAVWFVLFCVVMDCCGFVWVWCAVGL